MKITQYYTITVTHMRRNFSKIMKTINGKMYTVTSHGKIVGRILPYDKNLQIGRSSW